MRKIKISTRKKKLFIFLMLAFVLISSACAYSYFVSVNQAFLLFRNSKRKTMKPCLRLENQICSTYLKEIEDEIHFLHYGVKSLQENWAKT